MLNHNINSYFLCRTVINIFLFMTQMGFCCVYFVFVAANLHDVVKHYWVDINMHWYLLIMLLPMVLLNWVKSLKYLTPASLFASIVTVTGLVITFIYMLQDLPSTSTMKAFSSLEQLPLYFGVAIYAFEGIGVVSKLYYKYQHYYYCYYYSIYKYTFIWFDLAFRILIHINLKLKKKLLTPTKFMI